MIKSRASIEEDILNRFMQALDLLVQSGRIASRNAFCMECGLAKSFLSMLSSNQRRKVPMYAIYHIVSRYKISANWLIAGHGEMFCAQNLSQ